MTTTVDTELAYYATPGPFTDLSQHASFVDVLPRDVASLAKVVQGLLVHRFWAPAYRTETTPERDRQQGLRAAAAIIERAVAIVADPLKATRPPDQRVVGVCRHFATLLTAFLRYQRVPARARCGFATYFQPGKHVDHWVCEYWNEGEQRWVLVDAQLDDLQVKALKPDFDPLDVPRERFWVAGQAWQRIRSGEAAGETFGIADMWGPWFVKGDLLLDVASLNKVELLPWDVKDIVPDAPPDRRSDAAPPSASLDDEFVDRLAALSTGDDASIVELRALSASDVRLQVPASFLARAAEEDAAGGVMTNPATAAATGG